MTVLDNLFIGKERTSKLGILNMKEMKALANEQFRKLSVTIPLNQEAGNVR